ERGGPPRRRHLVRESRRRERPRVGRSCDDGLPDVGRCRQGAELLAIARRGNQKRLFENGERRQSLDLRGRRLRRQEHFTLPDRAAATREPRFLETSRRSSGVTLGPWQRRAVLARALE